MAVRRRPGGSGWRPVEDAKEARRAARDALALQAEVARLRELLAEAGVESGRYSPLSLRRIQPHT